MAVIFIGEKGLLDLAAAFIAAGAISSEIVLADLLDFLIKIVLENTGATEGKLLLCRTYAYTLRLGATTGDCPYEPLNMNFMRKSYYKKTGSCSYQLVEARASPEPYGQITVLEKTSIAETESREPLLQRSMLNYAVITKENRTYAYTLFLGCAVRTPEALM